MNDHPIKSGPARTPLRDLIRRVRGAVAQYQWKQAGRPVPPPQRYKAATIREYARRFDTTTLIETGTYLGETIEVVKTTFTRIYSIEIDEPLFTRARERFARHPHISILHGDSARVLPEVLVGIDVPCLFWLDGHYSGGITGRGEVNTPIVAELHQILAHPVLDHVILIDDARLFGREEGYPKLEEIRDLLSGGRVDRRFEVQDDIIRITPQSFSSPSRRTRSDRDSPALGSMAREAGD